MGNVSHALMKKGKTILFAFEEAIGFMNGSEVGAGEMLHALFLVWSGLLLTLVS